MYKSDLHAGDHVAHSVVLVVAAAAVGGGAHTVLVCAFPDLTLQSYKQIRGRQLK